MFSQFSLSVFMTITITILAFDMFKGQLWVYYSVFPASVCIAFLHRGRPWGGTAFISSANVKSV